MASTHIDIGAAPWTVGTAFCGPDAIFDGQEIVRVKLLSDRRSEGGGSAWLVKFSPPPGKLLKIVATARSDEHVFNLEGGRGTKTGTAGAIRGRLHAQPGGPSAQRSDRDRDVEPCHLPRRAGRKHLVRGGRRGSGSRASLEMNCRHSKKYGL